MSLTHSIVAWTAVIGLFSLAACSSEPTADPAGGAAGTPGAPAAQHDHGAADSQAPGGAPPQTAAAIPGSTAPGGGQPEVQSSAAGPGDTGGTASAGPPADLNAALGRYADSDRVALELLKKSCDEGRKCVEQVNLLANYIGNDCPRDSTCPKTLSGFLDPLDEAQRNGTVTLPDSYPTAAELRAIVDRATHDEARDEAGRASRPEPTETAEGVAPTAEGAGPTAEATDEPGTANPPAQAPTAPGTTRPPTAPGAPTATNPSRGG